MGNFFMQLIYYLKESVTRTSLKKPLKNIIIFLENMRRVRNGAFQQMKSEKYMKHCMRPC